jgi:geranylgeranyl diphosphate synthase type I
MQHNTPERVGTAVGEAIERLSQSVTPVASPDLDLFAPLSVLASKGKRLRSTLLVMSHTAAGGGRDDVALRVAAALELFQVAALVHDDVLDDSDTRRGLPSTHRVIEDLHRASGWRGDSVRFGTSGAILAGDLALMACMGELVAALTGVDASVAAAVGERFTTMATVCTAGQYLDLRLAAMPLEGLAHEREAIETVMRAKTASYTTVGPLALGAALAGCSPTTVDAWASVGLPLGVAFQLRDDVLGVIGTESDTGKPAGDDVREGKRTLLLAHALASSGAEDRDRIVSAVNGDPQAVADAVDVLVRSGAIDAAEAEISRLVSEAKAGLKGIPMDSLHRERLLGLFDALTVRVA